MEHDPNNPSKVYVTDQKYVRQIDVKTQKISKNVFNIIAVDRFSEERGIRQSDLNKEIRCIKIQEFKIWITTKNHGLLLLNNNWTLANVIQSERRALIDSQFQLDQIYFPTPQKMLLPFNRFDGWFVQGPEVLLYDLNSPEDSYILESDLDIQNGFLNTASKFISYVYNRLIFIEIKHRNNDTCLRMVLLTLPGLL